MAAHTRRELLASAATPLLAQTAGQGGRLTLCMHEATSAAFDFRAAMEGYSKAGIRTVEITLPKLREFAAKESAAAARRLLQDLGLKPVSCGSRNGVVEPNPNRAKNLEDFKWQLELAQAVGCDRMVMPSGTQARFTPDDYKRGVENARECGEMARSFGVTVMLEFQRTATFIGTLSTALKVVREANHPNVRVMLDTYHFWGGVSKFEDLELLREGELHHLHFEDTPADPPRELLEQRHRVLPGKGIAPLRRIVEALRKKGYSGPASVELFDPAIQAIDPYSIAQQARAAAEPLL
jgi:sugar phosphate isomerase/epimerase